MADAFFLETRLVYRFEAPCEVLLAVEPERTPLQRIIHEQWTAPPACRMVRFEDPATGARRTFVEAAGDLELGYSAEVETFPPDHDFTSAAADRIRDLPGEALEYLRPSRYCPSDRLERMARRQFGHLDGGAKAAAMLDWVGDQLSYEPGASNVSSSALDTLVDGAGVCRDYAHLAIALLRAADIPARAVSAYACDLNPPDMHAVVEVFLDGRWWLADPTGLAPLDGLIRVAAGRDAADIAFMNIFGRAQLLEQSFRVTRGPDLAAVA